MKPRYKLSLTILLLIFASLLSFKAFFNLGKAGYDMHFPNNSNSLNGNSQSSKDSFSMIFLSDTQLRWSCSDQGTTAGDYCGVADNRSKDLEVQAQETNLLHIKTIKKIKNSVNNFAGVVINGDLTSFGSQNNHLKQFQNIYSPLALETNVWFGLGNHDYENPVNDCGLKFWINYNYCSADMVQFLANSILLSKNSLSSYDIAEYKKNSVAIGNLRNVSGSLSYSWNVGNFHFIQLNNYPTYKTNFTRGFKSGFASWKIDISPTILDDGTLSAWLKNDLDNAVKNGQKIILNMHQYDYNDKNNLRGLAPYAKFIKAIFVGHLHGEYGHKTDLVFPAATNNSNISIPIIYSGSAIFNRFVKADFSNSNSGCVISTQVINTFTGLAVKASDGSDGRYLIDCGY